MTKRTIDVERKNKAVNYIGAGLLVADGALLLEVLSGTVLPQWAVATSLVLNGVLFAGVALFNASVTVTEKDE